MNFKINKMSKFSNKILRIGVIGYSSKSFPIHKAHTKLFEVLYGLISNPVYKNHAIEIWSGWTDYGIPALAYSIVDSLNLVYYYKDPSDSSKFEKIGIAPKIALQEKLCKVDRYHIVGSNYGDESNYFLSNVDILIKVGGGKQSINEYETFAKKFPFRKRIEIELESY